MTAHTLKTSIATTAVVLVMTSRFAFADVCVTIDESRDTLSASDRTAALLLLERQFELAGERIVPPGCDTPYIVSHVQLGSRVTVTLSGPKGQRDATTIGLDDVPSLYSQMVRSLLSGRPMNASGIVDRTNVSAAQSSEPKRISSDSVFYARLGYGGIFGDRTYGGPSMGFIGYRKELESFGIDVSFLNFQYKSSNGAYGSSSDGMTGTWLKLEALHYGSPLADRSPYWGGGLSWSGTNLDNGSKYWHGSGLQGELTAGYEIGRASTIRVFFQVDAGLPFYNLTSSTYSYSARTPYVSVTTEHRYAPSLTLSMGLGWQRGRR